jgi:DNA-binding transcriptional LysR family regulator
MEVTKNAWSHTPMDIPWEDVRLFLAVAEAGSLSAASKRLRTTQPTVSRRLAEVEATLGEPLFVRTAQGIALTSFGERLLEPSRRMAEWAAEVERAAERRETSPRGVVRVTAAPGVAFEVLAPFAAWMRSKLPDVQLEVRASVQYLDLSRREADLALRFGEVAQRDVVPLASLDVEVAAFAAPEYVATLPRRYGVADVAWVAWAPPFEELSPNPELARLIPGFRPAFASDDYLVQLRAAEAGVGAMFLGRVAYRFSPRRLVELSLELPPIRRSLHLACARSALEIPRVRAVADLLTAEWKLAKAAKRR